MPAARARSRHESLESLGVVAMPAGQGRAVVYDVQRRPENAFSVHLGSHLVIAAQDIEVAALEAGHQHVDDLIGQPGPLDVLALAGGGPAGYQQMGRDAAIRAIAKLVRETLRVGFERRLAPASSLLGDVCRAGRRLFYLAALSRDG